MTARSTTDRATAAALRRIAIYNAGREPERLARKYAAMRADAFTFFRATAHLCWDDLRAAQVKRLDVAPIAWSCGDLHLENFGTYRGDNGLAYFDLNDFDEAAIAPASWELVRLLTSVHLAAERLGLPAAMATTLAGECLDAYRAAIADGRARWVERATATGMIGDLLRRVRRGRAALLDERTEAHGRRRRLRLDDARALPIADVDREAVTRGVEAFGVAQDAPDFYRVLDVARRVSGTGSLGVERFVVLVRGDGARDGARLLDIKSAQRSTLARRAAVTQPRWPDDAARVVGVQRMMQAVSPALLHVVRVGGRGYVLRELQPSADRLALADAHGRVKRLRRVLRTMGRLAAWAQLRSSGRRGSATTDALQQFAAGNAWAPVLLEYAESYAGTVERTWRAFAASPK